MTTAETAGERRFNELEHVYWMQKQARTGRSVEINLGDDMAGIRIRGRTVLIACDMLMDGVHFDTRRHTYEQIGRKAMSVNLSDCAAMAVRPLAAVVSVAVPRGTTRDDARRLHRGLSDMARRFDVAVVGGDTNCWSKPLVVDVGVLAEPHPGIRPVRRSGARPGDGIFVTGPLGGSILGKHLRFTPRVREAEALARAFGHRLHAMMDISDGLLLDLHRMCRASGIGAQLDETLLSRIISPAAYRLSARDGRSALSHALTDGEDFELLLAVESGKRGAKPVPPGLRLIGYFTERGFSLKTREGRLIPLRPEGYVHR